MVAKRGSCESGSFPKLNREMQSGKSSEFCIFAHLQQLSTKLIKRLRSPPKQKILAFVTMLQEEGKLGPATSNSIWTTFKIILIFRELKGMQPTTVPCLTPSRRRAREQEKHHSLACSWVVQDKCGNLHLHLPCCSPLLCLQSGLWAFLALQQDRGLGNCVATDGAESKQMQYCCLAYAETH